jgi:uncharacterized protein YycO
LERSSDGPKLWAETHRQQKRNKRKQIRMPNPGDIVLQKDSPEKHPVDLIISFKSPHYAHCGVWVAPGRMIAASLAVGGVNYQSCSESDDCIVLVPDSFYSQPRAVVAKWADDQLFKPYDVAAWWFALVNHKLPISDDRFDCSNFLGMLFNLYTTVPIPFLRGTLPDDIARFLKVL